MNILENLKKSIWNIAVRYPNGFTYNAHNGMLLNKGYAVAAAETQDCIGKKGLYKVLKFCLRHPNYYIGGWRNEDGEMQFDASMVYLDMNEAIDAAEMNCQRALYNLYTRKEIWACDFDKFMHIVA